MFGENVITVPVAGDILAAVRAEQFIVKKYRLYGAGVADKKAVLNSAIDLELLAKGNAERVLFNSLSKYVKILGPFDRGRSVEYQAEIDLPYIRTKAIEDLDRKILALEGHRSHLQNQASWYRGEIAKLEEVIMDISRPWYTRVADWMSRP